MARVDEQTRFADILDVAREAFIQNAGFRRTQMAEVARRAGVAPGTLYLYVTSKEALFEAAIFASDDPDWPARQRVPYEARPMPVLIEEILARMNENIESLSTLRAGVASNRCAGFDELVAILGEYHDLVYRRRKVIKLIEACAADFPELAAMYWSNGRSRIASLLVQYLDIGMQSGAIRIVGDPLSSARHIIETFAFWALHRHWDPSPMNFDEETVRTNAIAFAAAPFRPLGQTGE